ncbi:MAG: hypothetical protein SPL19_03020, partial [Fibrobacter sp.]|nr:hypothetical protein [Fibrobacter sp.]
MGTKLNDIEGYPGMAIVPADDLCASYDLDNNEKFHQKVGSLVDQGFQNCRVKTIFVFGVLHI